MYEHIRGLREDRDLSQKDMSDFLQVHQTTYSDYELGKINIPVPTLIKLAQFFHTSTDFLIGLTNEKKPYPSIKK